MNYTKALAILRQEHARLVAAIQSLEALQSAGASLSERPPRRRGRKGMGAAERLQVSERMKRYWAKRRRERTAGASAR